MTERVFADTNVWAYLVDDDEPVKQARAREVLTPRPGRRHVTSAQVMSEFYVTATRKLARPMATDVAGRIVERLASFDVVSIDAGRVRSAIDGTRAWGISYWDALIVVAAQAGGCSLLLTEDLTDGATYGTVRVENPFRTRPQVSESRAPYGSRSSRVRWTDDELLLELSRYEEACQAAGMRPNAIHSYWDYARRFLAWRTGDYHPRGLPGNGRPVPTDPVAVQTLTAQLEAYVGALRAARLEPVTVDTYERHAAFFIRWLDGTFRPGRRVRR